MLKDTKYQMENAKSTAWSFSIIGVLGIVGIILMDTKVIPLSIDTPRKIMITIVMGMVFAFFLFTGIHSFLQMKQLSSKMAEQENSENTLIDWFLTEHSATMKTFQNDEMNPEVPDTFYYPRCEKISQLLQNHDSDLSESELEQLTEEIYNRLFPNEEVL